ncbi:MAG: outer membrane beta-barrel protein [Bacteroidota bacterium]
MENKDKLTEWYKQQIESNPYDPPESVWNNIHDELDVDNVWQRISSKLQKEQRRELIPYLVAASAILLFFLFYPFQNQQSYNLAENEINKNFPNLEATSGQNKTRNIYSKKGFIGESGEFVSSAFNTLNTDGNFTASIPEEREESIPDNETTMQNELTKLNYHSSGLPEIQSTPKLALHQPLQPEQKSTQPDEEKKFKPQFYAGVSGELGKSWLLSNKTIYSMTNSPFSSANPSNESSFGFNGGVKISERWAFELGASFNGNKGQVYKEYTDGQLVTNQISLNYSSLNMKGRYKFISKTKNLPVSHNLVFGTYMGSLSNASQKIESSSNNIKSDYKNFDLGLLIGYEFDAQILPNYTLSTGIQIDPGLINIYKGNEELPASFNKTYNASIGVNISIKRNF